VLQDAFEEFNIGASHLLGVMVFTGIKKVFACVDKNGDWAKVHLQGVWDLWLDRA
jgi:hypothetical protein